MLIYSIRDWDSLFENNRSRTVKDLSWIAIPNRHDGENFSAIMLHEKGAEIFSAWVLILQVASRCQPRGTLLRDNGKPHNSDSLSIKTRAPKRWFDLAFKFLTEQTDWLETKQVAEERQEAVTTLSPPCQSGDEERKEGKGMEGKGKHGMEPATVARVLIAHLNEKSGRKFTEVGTNLDLIMARLKEPDVDLEGCKKMIDRQVLRWKGTDQEEFLRPETLFGKTKFNGYYAARELPVTKTGFEKPQNNPKSNFVEPTWRNNFGAD